MPSTAALEYRERGGRKSSIVLRLQINVLCSVTALCILHSLFPTRSCFFVHSVVESLESFFHFRPQALYIFFSLAMSFGFFFSGKHYPGFIWHGRWLEVRCQCQHLHRQSQTGLKLVGGVLMADFHRASSSSPICLSFPLLFPCPLPPKIGFGAQDVFKCSS